MRVPALRPLSALNALAALGWLGTVVAFSDAGVSWPTTLAVIALGAALLTGWTVLFVGKRRDASSLSWAAAPAAIATVVILTLWGNPPHNPAFRLRFLASREPFAEEAEGALVTPPPEGPHWVGLFRVHRVEVARGQVRFLCASCRLVDRCGLIYSPRRPDRLEEGSLVPLGGPWYHLHEKP